MDIPIQHAFLYYVNLIIIWYLLFANGGYIFLLLAAIPDIFTQFKEKEVGNLSLFLDSHFIPPITALIPCYNEGIKILNTIESLLNSDYKHLKICVINDGSDDETIELLVKDYDLIPIEPVILSSIQTQAKQATYYISRKHPQLRVIDKEHSGKADSLNFGLNACSTPLFITVDADTLLYKNTISSLAYSLLMTPHTLAVGGALYVLNGCEYENGHLIKAKMPLSPIIAMQACDYLRAFVFGRAGWRIASGSLILPGALTLFERQSVLNIGGFRINSPGEDMDVIVGLHEYMRIRKYPYNIGYNLAAVAWTHVPTNINDLWSQRDRWHRGLLDSLLHFKKMFLNPKYGATGLFTYPFQVFVEALGPIVEFTGYIAITLAMYLKILNWQFAFLFFVANWGITAIITFATVLISMITFNEYRRLRDIIILFFVVIFETCGYRQILSICRFIATIRYLFR